MTSEELNKFYMLKNERIELKQLLKELIESGTYHSSIINGMPKSKSDNDKIGNYVSKIDILEEKIILNLNEMIVERCTLEDYVSAIDNSEMRLLMRLRHVQGVTWKEIGKEMECSESTALKKYKRHLEKLSN